MKRFFFLILSILLGGSFASAKISPGNLTCEYLADPSVVDVAQPRLAWINLAEKGERGQTQTAFQVRVATDQVKLEKPDLWDSQKTDSDRSNRIVYAGKKLLSGMECWWQVRVWDKDGNVSAWSKPIASATRKHGRPGRCSALPSTLIPDVLRSRNNSRSRENYWIQPKKS